MSRKVMAAFLAHPEVRPLLSDEHFSVDGTLVKAWAAMKSFQPKADEAAPSDTRADPGESPATAPPHDDDPGGPASPDATAVDPSQPQQTETQPMPDTPRQTRNAEVNFRGTKRSNGRHWNAVASGARTGGASAGNSERQW